MITHAGLPKGMTLADLGRKSVRRNALIADLLHRIDFIEKAGTGVKRIRDESREGGYPEPLWEANGFVTAVFRPNHDVRAAAESQVSDKPPASTPQGVGGLPDKYPTSTRQVLSALQSAPSPLPRAVLQEAAGLRDREHFVNDHLEPLLSAGLIERTIPSKPRSSKQRYRLTAAGREFLKTQDGGK